MKKAMRLFLSGSMQSMFFRQFIKSAADTHNVRGFVRNREDGRVEIFLEGNHEDVDAVTTICKRGPKYAQIRSIEEQVERFQDFQDFRILNF